MKLFLTLISLSLFYYLNFDVIFIQHLYWKVTNEYYELLPLLLISSELAPPVLWLPNMLINLNNYYFNTDSRYQ